MSEQQYKHLTHEDTIQAGDEFCVSIGQDRWHQYPTHVYGSPVSAIFARRPIRTTQQAIDQPQRERIAYEELRVGDPIMDGDEWQNGDGRWQLFSVAPIQVREGSRVRRPYKVSTFLEVRLALADALKTATQLQDERDDACRERDLARAEVARLSTELWARKPLEERVASLTHELANAREDFRKLVKTNVENTDQFAEHTATLVRERDEARAKSDRLQGLIDNLLDEPTAKQVRDMLRTWAIELDWSAGCFDSVSREQIDIIQKTLIAVIERIEWLCSENSDDN